MPHGTSRSSTGFFQSIFLSHRKDGEGLFTRVCSDSTKGNGSKLKRGDLD